MCTTDTLTSKRCGGKLRHCRDYWGAKYAMVFQNNKNLFLTNVTIREIKNSFEYDVFLLAISGNLSQNVTAVLRWHSEKTRNILQAFLELVWLYDNKRNGSWY